MALLNSIIGLVLGVYSREGFLLRKKPLQGLFLIGKLLRFCNKILLRFSLLRLYLDAKKRLITRVAGIEPTRTVLKTVVLPLNYTPFIVLV